MLCLRYTAYLIEGDNGNQNQGQKHDAALYKISRTDREEAAKCRIGYDDTSRDEKP